MEGLFQFSIFEYFTI